MAITDYKVVKAPLGDAEALIGRLIADGWQPWGVPVMLEPDNCTIYQAMTKGEAEGGGSGPTTIVVANITDATATGQAVMLAEDAAAARTAIGAGTSSLALGTSSTTAKAGNYQPAAANISDASAIGQSLIKAADAAAGRAAIGAGTSSLALGTTAGTALAGNTALLAIGTSAATAKAGNYQPSAANISDAGAFGRQLLQAADQAAAKTLLGIE